MKHIALLSLDKLEAFIRRTRAVIIDGISEVTTLKVLFGMVLSLPTVGFVMVWNAYTERDTPYLIVGMAFVVVSTVIATVFFIIVRESIAQEAASTRKRSRRNHPTSIHI